MRPSRFVPFAAAGFGAWLLIPALALAGPWLPAPGEYSSEFRVTHVGIIRTYDDAGEKSLLPFATALETRELRATNELGWKRRLSGVLSIPLRSATSRSQNEFLRGTQTGLGDLLAGARIRILDGATAVAAELDWQLPMGYDRAAFPALGSGLHHAIGTLELGTGFAPLQGFLEASVGYDAAFDVRLHPTGASRHIAPDALLGTADLAFWLGKSILLAGRVEAAQTLGGDSLDVKQHLYTAGPEVLYRVDDRIDVFAGAAFPLAGKNTVAPRTFYTGITFKQTHLNRLQGFLGGTRRP